MTHMLRPSRRVVGRSAVAAVLASFFVPIAAAAPASAESQEPPVSISVDPGALKNHISPTLFGANHRYAYGGFGMWDTAQQQAYPGFAQQVQDAGIGAIRYPGGTIANRFDWKASIGPVSERRPSAHGGDIGEPITAEFGPDEFGQFLDETGAVGTIVVNFATADAAEAADWVEYMTAPIGTNPRGGTAWADVRAANGRTEPYDIAYWEVANEPDLGGQKYWRDGVPTASPAPGAAELYAHGGSTRFTRQWAAREADYRSSAARSDGTAGQEFLVRYAPVASGSATVYVNGTAWQRVASLSGAGNTNVYTLDEATGRIAFGDGTHGRIPPTNAVVDVTYVSGPHDGFVDFYREMKAANPQANVCLGAAANDFLDAMGSDGPYDCAVYHSYVTQNIVPGGTPWTDFRTRFLTKPDDMLYYVDRASRKIADLRNTQPGEIPVIVTEYGHMGYGNSYPSDAPHYHRSLDEGLYNAEYLRQLIGLGTIDVAMRHALIDYQFADAPAGSTNVGTPDDGMFGGPGPDIIPQAQALVNQLFKPLHGQTTVLTSVSGSPDIVAPGGDSADALTSMSSVDEHGNLTIMVINRSADEDLAAAIDPGFEHESSALIRTVTGDSPVAYNTPEDRDGVALTSTTSSVGSGEFTYVFPKHSVTTIRLEPRTGTPLFVDHYDGEATGNPPTGYTVSAPAGAVAVAEDSTAGKVLALTRTAPGSQLIAAQREIGSFSGDLEVVTRVRASQRDAALGLHVLDASGQPVARVSLTASGRYAYTDGATFINAGPYTDDAWHDVSIVIHRASGTYDLEVDGELLVQGASLQRPAATAAAVRIQIPTTSSRTSRFELDEVSAFDLATS